MIRTHYVVGDLTRGYFNYFGHAYTKEYATHLENRWQAGKFICKKVV